MDKAGLIERKANAEIELLHAERIACLTSNPEEQKELFAACDVLSEEIQKLTEEIEGDDGF